MSGEEERFRLRGVAGSELFMGEVELSPTLVEDESILVARYMIKLAPRSIFY